MLQTDAGQLSTDGQIIQPNGDTKAYPISINRPLVFPLPNQSAALAINPSLFAERGIVGLGIYNSFYNHLTVTTNRFVADKVFWIPTFSFNSSPDHYFRYTNGSIRTINGNSISYSDNGRYFIAEDTKEGFMKFNTYNYDVSPYMDSLPRQQGISISDEVSTDIDNEGKIAVASYRDSRIDTTFFKVTDTTDCTLAPTQNVYGKSNKVCRTRDYYKDLQRLIPGLTSITSVDILNDRTIAFDAFIKQNNNSVLMRYTMTAPGQKKQLVDYLAMGDSYISGEGAFDYRVGTDTERNRCHQSLVSYPYLFANNFHSFADVACSGAQKYNVTGNTVGSQHIYQLDHYSPSRNDELIAKHENLPGYIKQMDFINNDNPNVITISIGGNDIGFSSIVSRCVNFAEETKHLDYNCYSTYEDRAELVDAINKQFRDWRQLFADLLSKDFPDRRVYVIGYPIQISAVGNICESNVRMNLSERQFGVELVEYLNSVIKKAANEAGVFYVDTQDAFNGHKLCEDINHDTAMNGLTLTRGADGTLDYTHTANWTESFHPNQLGHQLLAQTILAKTYNLTAPMPAVPAEQTISINRDDNIPLLRGVPKTNRQINQVDYRTDMVPPILLKGKHFYATVDSPPYVQTGSQFTAEVHSTPLNLGTFTVGNDGKLPISFTLPESLEPGMHSIHLYGQDVFHKPIDITQNVYIAASENDYDGDGIPNDKDSCDIITNSGQDADMDGIDDACDGVIGDLPRGVNSAGALNSTNQYGSSLVQTAPFIGSTHGVNGAEISAIGDDTLQQGSGQAAQSLSETPSGVLGTMNDEPTDKKDNLRSSYLLDTVFAALIGLPILFIGWRWLARAKA